MPTLTGAAVAGSKREPTAKRRNPVKLEAAVLAQEWLTRERLTGAVTKQEQTFLEMFIADMELG